MEFVVPQKALVAALERVVPFAAQKSPQYTLEMLRIEARPAPALGKSVLAMNATDLYTAGSTEIEADVARPGRLAVHARSLLERVKTMPVGPVLIEADGGNVRIKSVGSARRFQLATGDADDIPGLDGVGDKAWTTTMDTAALAARLDEVAPCISTDESRPHINCALFRWDDRFTLVATDGHRLALTSTALTAPLAPRDMLVPLGAVDRLRKVLDPKVAEKVVISVERGTAVFALGAVDKISVKLIDAKFPPHTNVIPEDRSRTVRVSRLDLLDMVSKAALAADDKARVRFTFKPGKLLLTAESPDHGSAYDELDAAGDASLTMLVSSKYIAAALAALDTDEVLLALPTDDLSALRIDPTPRDGLETTIVIMPMR